MNAEFKPIEYSENVKNHLKMMEWAHKNFHENLIKSCGVSKRLIIDKEEKNLKKIK